MLSPLLDENISPKVAVQMSSKRPDIRIESLFHWRDGEFVGRPDHLILAAAVAEALALVTYDQKTIMPEIRRLGDGGAEHRGVIFVDERTIAPNDFGALIAALSVLWDSGHDDAWTNRVEFLRRPNG